MSEAPPTSQPSVPAPSRHAPIANEPTPGIFDFGAMTPPPQRADPDEDRFVTNERFTEEDLQHPERYFEAAEHKPELNRPEARRAALDYFVAYREKLQQDLAGGSLSTAARAETLATIARYDAAIARMRALIAGAD